jgi:hypothetical protein
MASRCRSSTGAYRKDASREACFRARASISSGAMRTLNDGEQGDGGQEFDFRHEYKRASNAPDLFSTVPWPKGCTVSAGLPDVPTANGAITTVRSTKEWRASDITDTDPITMPMVSSSSTGKIFETTESSATDDFFLSMKSFLFCIA